MEVEESRWQCVMCHMPKPAPAVDFVSHNCSQPTGFCFVSDNTRAPEYKIEQCVHLACCTHTKIYQSFEASAREGAYEGDSESMCL